MSNSSAKTNLKRVDVMDVKHASSNRTNNEDSAPYAWATQLNPSTLSTGFYILVGLSCLIVLYFVCRAIRY